MPIQHGVRRFPKAAQKYTSVYLGPSVSVFHINYVSILILFETCQPFTKAKINRFCKSDNPGVEMCI